MFNKNNIFVENGGSTSAVVILAMRIAFILKKKKDFYKIIESRIGNTYVQFDQISTRKW